MRDIKKLRLNEVTDDKAIMGLISPGDIISESIGDQLAAEEWHQWNHLLHGLTAERFSAWRLPAPASKNDIPIQTGPLQVIAFILQSFSDFERWLVRENAQDGLYYRKVCQQQREKAQCEYIVYHCHKSGPPRLKQGERKRKSRENRTKKLGFTCTSKITVRRHLKDSYVTWKRLSGRRDADDLPIEQERIPVKNGQVSVMYVYTHAHSITEADVKETPISDHTKRLIKVWRALGLSVDEIHDNLIAARSDDATQAEAVGVTIPTMREAHINKRDLRNILVAANMYKRDAPRPDDGQESDIRCAGLLIEELKHKYGTGNDPLPPPFWGTQLAEQDARAARISCELFQHLTAASEHLEELSMLLNKVDEFSKYKSEVDLIRSSTLMNISKRLLFPSLLSADRAGASGISNADENVAMSLVAASNYMASDTDKQKTDGQHYVV